VGAIKKFFNKYFKVEPIIENPFGRKTLGAKFTLKSKQQKTRDKITKIIQFRCPNRNIICFNDSFELDYGFDSLDAVEFIMILEDEFKLEIPDEDAEKVKRVQDVYDLIEKLLEK